MIALVGRPNSGKTTLFNWLTGSRFRAVNYPGATVDCYVGRTHERYGNSIQVVDTPGTYSLFPKSPDEEVTYNTLFKRHKDLDIRGAVVLMDSTQLARQMLLVQQLKSSGFPVIVALTMSDLVKSEGLEINASKLSEILQAPVVSIDGQLGGGVKELVEAMEALPPKDEITELKPWSGVKMESAIREAEKIARQVQNQTKQAQQLSYFRKTHKLDSLLLHPVLGLFLFFAVMTALFTSIFWLATPFMDYVDQTFAWMATSVLNLAPGQLWSDLLANGVIASVGAVAVFVPQIFILFVGISFLEDSGYLARAATLIDRPFSKVGLSGRSFVPLLSGYACAVPAMMATRNIRSPRERWIAMFIIPLMTCSARLPVYALLLSFLFFGQAAWKPGLVLAGLYIGALFLGGIAASILNRILRANTPDSFMMELPFYRKPSVRVVLRTALTRTRAYIYRAGPIIFTLALVVWVGTTFPTSPGADEATSLKSSAIGQLGQVIEPVFEPMGADWRVGIGLITAFAAREVFVSSLAVVFNIAGDDEDSISNGLISKMQSATTDDGRALFTPASVLAIIVFFMIALQCLSTFAMARQEMASWKFAWIQLIALNVVAYVLAVAVYQVASAVG